MLRDILSTNWSNLAASLTHLSFGGLVAIPLQIFLERFPNMMELTIHQTCQTSLAPSVVTTPHHSLYVLKYSCSVYALDMSKYVMDLLSVVQSGMLPGLRQLVVTRWKSSNIVIDGGLPWGKFRSLGVTLAVRTVRPPGTYKVKGRHEFLNMCTTSDSEGDSWVTGREIYISFLLAVLPCQYTVTQFCQQLAIDSHWI